MFTLIVLIAHTVSDFIFQTKIIVDSKADIKVKGFLYHGLTLFLISCVLIGNTNFSTIGKVIIIVVLHIMIDISKELIQNRFDKEKIGKYRLIIFIFDQLIHFAIILILSSGIVLEYTFVNEFLIKVLSMQNPIDYQIMKYLFIIIYVTMSGAYIIPAAFDLIYSNVDGYTKKIDEIIKTNVGSDNEKKFIDEVRTGKWIGILERLLMLVFLVLNELAALGFIIAVKSFARFKMMDNKIFSEYYLLGTLLSVVYTLMGFYTLNFLL